MLINIRKDKTMLAYFMSMGGLAMGFIMGTLYSEQKHKKEKSNESKEN